MNFETSVYWKDLREIECAFISKKNLLFWRIEGGILGIIFLLNLFSTNNFFSWISISLFISSIGLLFLSFWNPIRVRKAVRLLLIKISNGQEQIDFQYSLRNHTMCMHNLNTYEVAEFQVSDAIYCKETKHYYIYILSDKRIFFVNKSMKELETFKQLFHPKKYYNLQ